MDNTKPAEPGKVWAARALEKIAAGKTKFDISDCQKQILPEIKILLSKSGGRNLIHRVLNDRNVETIRVVSKEESCIFRQGLGYCLHLNFDAKVLLIGKSSMGKKIMIQERLFMTFAHELVHITHGKSDKRKPPTKGKDYHNLEEEKTIDECNQLRKEFGLPQRDNHASIDEKRYPESLCYFGLFDDLKMWVDKHKKVTQDMVFAAAKGDRLEILYYLKSKGGHLKDPELLEEAVAAGSPRVVRHLVRLMPFSSLYQTAFNHIKHLPTLRQVIRELGLGLQTEGLDLCSSKKLTDEQLQTLLEVKYLNVLDIRGCSKITAKGILPLKDKGVIVFQDVKSDEERRQELYRRRREWHTKP